MSEIIAAIQKLFDDPSISNYKLEKETGLKQSMLGKYTRGESEIGSMSLNNALTLYNYYIKVKEAGEINTDQRDFLWGMLWGATNKLSEKVFEKQRAAVATIHTKKFMKSPMSTWTKVHEDLMNYQHKFGESEEKIIRIFTDILNKMNPLDFSDEPLTDKYILGFYKQQSELAKTNVMK